MDDNVINVGDIIRRIKEVKGFKSDRQVADYLGVSKATVSVENASTCDGFVVKSSSIQLVRRLPAKTLNVMNVKVIALIV